MLGYFILGHPMHTLACCIVNWYGVHGIIAVILCDRLVYLCGPGAIPLIPSLSHSPIFWFVFYLFPLSYFLHLYSCFFIPSQSTIIVPLCFQAGCCRMRLHLALIFMCVDFVLYVFFS